MALGAVILLLSGPGNYGQRLYAKSVHKCNGESLEIVFSYMLKKTYIENVKYSLTHGTRSADGKTEGGLRSTADCAAIRYIVSAAVWIGSRSRSAVAGQMKEFYKEKG